ncbi:MAG: hypothetical protein AAB221_05805, partial [Bacteroidota bacterium]
MKGGRKINGELAERYRTGLLSQGWDNTLAGSIPAFSAMFVGEHNSVMRKSVSASVYHKQKDE